MSSLRPRGLLKPFKQAVSLQAAPIPSAPFVESHFLCPHESWRAPALAAAPPNGFWEGLGFRETHSLKTNPGLRGSWQSGPCQSVPLSWAPHLHIWLFHASLPSPVQASLSRSAPLPLPCLGVLHPSGPCFRIRGMDATSVIKGTADVVKCAEVGEIMLGYSRGCLSTHHQGCWRGRGGTPWRSAERTRSHDTWQPPGTDSGEECTEFPQAPAWKVRRISNLRLPELEDKSMLPTSTLRATAGVMDSSIQSPLHWAR